MCPVVSALSLELPQRVRDDAGEGSDGRPDDGVPLGAFLLPPNWINDAELISNPRTIHGALTKPILKSRASGNISIGVLIHLATRASLC